MPRKPPPSISDLRKIQQAIDDGSMDPSSPAAWLTQSQATVVSGLSRYTLARYAKDGRLVVSKRSPKTWLVFVPSLLSMLPSPTTVEA